MRKTTAAAAAAAICCALATQASSATRDLNTVKEGDAIPAFKGRTLDGGEIDVGALIGKKILVLSFWSIYCKPCVDEISSLIRLQEQLGDEKFQIIGVNADSELGVVRIRTFLGRFEEFERRKVNYPLVFDEGGKIAKSIGIGFLPTVLSVNLKGQVQRIFMGFEEKSEPEIFAGIRGLLPLEGAAPEPESTVYSVEAAVPLCGFYDNRGWKGSFQENYDLDKELERVAGIAQRKAAKLALREALTALGVNLLRDPQEDSCFRPQGVTLVDDPFRTTDSFTNLLEALPTEKLVRVLESQEDFLYTEYHISQRISISLPELKSKLEGLKVQLTPRKVTFSAVNLRKLDLERFKRTLLRQSRYIGAADFPAYQIYTTTENFAAEVKGMDFGKLKLFIEEAEGDKIEVEAWK